MDGIKEIFDKISSYNIFNNLLPGILFVFITKAFIGLDLVQENNFIGAFLYYFIGMVISRIGSIIIEPFLKKIKFVKFSDYKKYVAASKKDEKIELFSEINNTYRTLLSMLTTAGVLKVYIWIKTFYGISHSTSMMIVLLSILFLFLFSYRKQTSYITKRIEANQ